MEPLYIGLAIVALIGIFWMYTTPKYCAAALGACPDGWTADGDKCLAPDGYVGGCSKSSGFRGYTDVMKQGWAKKCGADWTAPDSGYACALREKIGGLLGGGGDADGYCAACQ